MRKSRWIIGIALVVVISITVAREQHDSREEYEAQRQKDCIALSFTSEEKHACDKDAQSRKDYAEWWYVLVEWPNGIGALALIATLVGILWQADETRNSAEAANRNLDMVVNKERPRLLIQLQPFTTIINDYPAIRIRVTNIGGSKAIFGLCLIGIEATDLKEATIAKKPSNTVMMKNLCGKILPPEELHEELIDLHYPAEVFPPNFDKSRPYKVHVFGILNFRDILFDDSWVREFHYVLVSMENVYMPQFGKWSAEFWSPLMEEVDKRRVKPNQWMVRYQKAKAAWKRIEAWQARIDADDQRQSGDPN